MTDISKLDDVKHLVDTFYTKVRQDDLLGDIFNTVIEDRWPVHLEKMYSFWQTVLLSEYTYKGSPFAPHAKLPVEKAHFDRWKMLFCAAIDASFVGPKADEAKWRADKMGRCFS
ncbi:MAG: hemoglobin [Saprospiraceae bacterium]|jgi:hemoglobin